jgi:predicted amidophosphoribosyltransferase
MSEPTSPSAYAVCPACTEQNKVGSTACARCGGPLQVVGGVVDPELRDFNRVQDALTRKERQRRTRILGGDFAGLLASFFRR